MKGYLYIDLKTNKSFEFSPVKLGFEKAFAGRVQEQEYDNYNKCILDHFKQFNQVKTAEEVEKEIEKEAMKKYQKIQNDQEGRLKGIQT